MLRLREPADGDAESVLRIHTSGSATDVWFGGMTDTQALAYIREATSSPVLLVRGIEVDGDLLGVVRLGPDTDGSTGRLGHIARGDARGNGYASAAVRRFLAGAPSARVPAVHREADPASGRIPAKADFAPVCASAGLVHYEL